MFHAQRDPRHTLKMSRIIPASRKEVFEAWTTAESLKQWICPEDSSVSFIELDVRVGGTFRIEMHHVDEGAMVLTGIYREIRPPGETGLYLGFQAYPFPRLPRNARLYCP